MALLRCGDGRQCHGQALVVLGFQIVDEHVVGRKVIFSVVFERTMCWAAVPIANETEVTARDMGRFLRNRRSMIVHPDSVFDVPDNVPDVDFGDGSKLLV